MAVLVCSAASCILKTDVVPEAFNGGALDSAADPYRDPGALKRSIVTRLLLAELEDGYFAPNDDTKVAVLRGYQVAAWATAAANDAPRFAEEVRRLAEGRPAPGGAQPESSTPSQQSQAPVLAPDWTDEWTRAGDKRPLCVDAKPDDDAYARLLDEVRFTQAVARAAVAIAEKLDERLIDLDDVTRGAHAAFTAVAAHLTQRRWAREFVVPTTGLVIKGGSANGIFSAGAVWTVLNLIDGRTIEQEQQERELGRERKKRRVDHRFKLVSGTSTGAMVAVAVDRYNDAGGPEARRDAIRKLARWFTCFSVNDLYCVDSGAITRLIDSGEDALHGVLRFDGIEQVMDSCVTTTMLDNRSELLLNTVDFRSGRLFSLSDQAELSGEGDVDRRACLVQAALASALLPVIGQPVRHLPAFANDRPYLDNHRSATEPAYLDGGIRSEIPLLPLVRRGAERVLVVSSSASVLNETKRLRNAAALAARYIDVNTGALSEVELAHAQRYAESVRLEEINACHRALRARGRPLCDPQVGCDADAFCSGVVVQDEDARKNACRRRPPGPRPESGPDPVPAPVAVAALTRTVSERIEPFWRVQGIFRAEGKVEGLNGYDFDPPELNRLFRAGAEAARQRCVDIAKLLGIVTRRQLTEDKSGALRRKLVGWCSPSVPKAELLCTKNGTREPLSREEGGELRQCGQEPPAYLDDCLPTKPAEERPRCGQKAPPR